MDFNDTKEEAEFRAEARAFLGKHLEPKGDKPLRQRVDGSEFMKLAKQWQKTKSEGGYAQITWPKEIGGRGGTPPSASGCASRPSSRSAPTSTRSAMSARQ